MEICSQERKQTTYTCVSIIDQLWLPPMESPNEHITENGSLLGWLYIQAKHDM